METENYFDPNEYQVVHRELFAHTQEPAATFCACRFYVNAACLSRFPENDTVQVLVNRERRLLALMPCPENQREALLWCLRPKDGKRKPRHVTCRLFFAMLCSLMDWDPGLRYRVLGQIVQDDGLKAVLFDLSAAEIYRSDARSAPWYPADWREQFGPGYREHKQFVTANLVEGYTVYSIGEGNASTPSLPGKHTEAGGKEGSDER